MGLAQEDFDDLDSGDGEKPSGGTFGQTLLYPARDGHDEDQEKVRAVEWAIELAQDQLKKAYTDRSGRIYDLDVNLAFQGSSRRAEISVNCSDSVEVALERLESQML